MIKSDMSILKKIKFLSSKRAILENEIVLKKFYYYVENNYSEEELENYAKFLETVYDSDLFDVIINKKKPENFNDRYNTKFLNDLKNFIKNFND